MSDNRNHILLKEIPTQYGYQETSWIINGKSLPEYLNDWAAGSQNETLLKMGNFVNLCSAWSKELDYRGDIRWVWKLINTETAVLPLLLCPEDLDFTCIVIVADVAKTKEFVYWHRIGYVLHDNADFEVDMNYTSKYYQKEENICWFLKPEWVFDRTEYEQMVTEFWERETLQTLQNFQTEKKLSVKECAYLLADLEQDGSQVLEEHMEDYGEILLHVLAGDLVTEPLIDLLKNHKERRIKIQSYCKAIEYMWKLGNDDVVNVVDVTILERLQDDNEVWQSFGTYISEEMKHYVNEEVIPINCMMSNTPLK